MSRSLHNVRYTRHDANRMDDAKPKHGTRADARPHDPTNRARAIAWRDSHPEEFAHTMRKMCAAWMSGNGGNAVAIALTAVRYGSGYVKTDGGNLRENLILAEGITELVMAEHREWFAK